MLIFILGLFNLDQKISIPQCDTIYWCAERKLRWEDFKWNEMAPSGALSATTVHVKVIEDSVKVQLNVFAIFLPGESWTNDTSCSLLEHEQIHFDIAELTVRRIRKFLSEQTVTRSNYEVILEKIYALISFQGEINERFDSETYHGYVEKKQNEWRDFIRSELRRLMEYEVKCIDNVQN